MNMINKELYGWVFNYNPLDELFRATTRDNYNLFWNDQNNELILKSKEINTLFDIIIRCGGDIEEVLKFKEDGFN